MPRINQVPTLSPEQQQYQNQILQLLSGLTPDVFQYLQGILGGDEEAFKAFEAPYLRQFERDILPRISEQFTGGAGSHGSLASSGLNQSLAQAATDLQTNLASLRSGLKSQALGQLQGFQSPAFQSPFQTTYQQKSPSFLQSLLPGLGTALGGGLGLALGGPAGLGVGTSLGRALAGGFNKQDTSLKVG